MRKINLKSAMALKLGTCSLHKSILTFVRQSVRKPERQQKTAELSWKRVMFCRTLRRGQNLGILPGPFGHSLQNF